MILAVDIRSLAYQFAHAVVGALLTSDVQGCATQVISRLNLCLSFDQSSQHVEAFVIGSSQVQRRPVLIRECVNFRPIVEQHLGSRVVTLVRCVV